MGFSKGDKVRVIKTNSLFEDSVGVVDYVFEDERTCTVRFESVREGGTISGFFVSELEPVDEKREALIELAETLEKARLQANVSEEYVIASQRGVYGQIVLSLKDTLEVIFDGQVDGDENLFATRAYESILDGNTVREALAAVVKA